MPISKYIVLTQLPSTSRLEEMLSVFSRIVGGCCYIACSTIAFKFRHGNMSHWFARTFRSTSA